MHPSLGTLSTRVRIFSCSPGVCIYVRLPSLLLEAYVSKYSKYYLSHHANCSPSPRLWSCCTQLHSSAPEKGDKNSTRKKLSGWSCREMRGWETAYRWLLLRDMEPASYLGHSIPLPPTLPQTKTVNAFVQPDRINKITLRKTRK